MYVIKYISNEKISFKIRIIQLYGSCDNSDYGYVADFIMWSLKRDRKRSL